jgi:transmembrane sensor
VKLNDNHIDDLIGKYLAGEASAEETNSVLSWASENEANKLYLQQITLIFNKTKDVQHHDVFNADTAWQNLKSRIDQKNTKTISLADRQPSSQHWYLKIAASLLVILGIGYLFFWYNGKATIDSVNVTTEATTVSDTLPDGTSVYLNKGTQLAYTFDKKKNAHVVKLNGEAFFNISNDDDKDFIIDAGGVFIRDIGTSFNVKAYPESGIIEVTVEEGEVMFFTDTDSGLYLKKDGRGLFDKKTKKFSIAQPEPNTIAYKTKSFSFTNADLASVVRVINGVYDEKILLSDSVKNCRITVNFNHEEIDEIADIIAETLGLTSRKGADSIYLTGSPCEPQ